MNKSNIELKLEDKIQFRALQNSMKSDLLLEEVKSEYFNDKIIITQPETIYRINYDYQRFYCRIIKDSNGNISDYIVYPSLTTIIKKNMPTDKFLLKWWSDLGYDRASIEMSKSASYGTLLHILFAEILRGSTVNLNETNLSEIIKIHTQYDRWYSEINIREWIKNLKQDLIGFIIWINDYEIDPIGIEYIEYSDEKRYATAIDLIAYARIKKDADKTIIVCDFKSGRKNFYDEYPIQLRACTDLWNEKHPEYIANEFYNYGCKDYRIPIGKTVTQYRFERQTEKTICQRWTEYLSIYHREHMPSKDEITKRLIIDEIPISKDIEIGTVFKEVDIIKDRFSGGDF
jgi:hypothetical protein